MNVPAKGNPPTHAHPQPACKTVDPPSKNDINWLLNKKKTPMGRQRHLLEAPLSEATDPSHTPLSKPLFQRGELGVLTHAVLRRTPMSNIYCLWHHLHLRKVSFLCQIKALYSPFYNLYGHLRVGSHPEGTLEITNVVLYQFAQGLSFKTNPLASKYWVLLQTSLVLATCLHPGQKQLNMNLFTFSNL